LRSSAKGLTPRSTKSLLHTVVAEEPNQAAPMMNFLANYLGNDDCVRGRDNAGERDPVTNAPFSFVLDCQRSFLCGLDT